MVVQIRKATNKDRGAILDLLFELGRPRPQKRQKISFVKLIRRYISDKDKQILVATHNSKIVGLATVVFLPRLNRTTSELWIPELVVSSDYRKKGIGKKLINHCIKIAKSKKCFRIRLESRKNRKVAHQFYKKIGFVDVADTFTKS
jgi:ribosomal protein S18 acetylase RimI-like enzyme